MPPSGRKRLLKFTTATASQPLGAGAWQDHALALGDEALAPVTDVVGRADGSTPMQLGQRVGELIP
jgi:hypothetical protein